MIDYIKQNSVVIGSLLSLYVCFVMSLPTNRRFLKWLMLTLGILSILLVLLLLTI